MKITIHRGTQTIGGTCVEIQHQKERLLIDLGMPLMASGGLELDGNALKNPSIKNGILPDIEGLYNTDKPTVSAIFISHAHIDHCGLLNHVHPDIPVYCSAGTHSLIKIGRVFYPNESKILFDKFKIFEHWNPIELAGFRITSYLMDHSGYDASAFLVEIDNKKIFYSGDFRGHGRKSILLDRLINNPIQNIDCLLMEGTTLGGKHQVGFNTEAEVEQAFYEIFSAQKDISFIAAAGSNVDRLVSLYKASLKSQKTLVLDLYTYYLLHQLKKITPGLPPFTGDNIRVFYLYGHAKKIVEYLDKNLLYQFKNRKIEVDEIIANRKNMVIKLPMNAILKISKKVCHDKPLEKSKLIYSMWQGYIEKDGIYYDFCKEFNTELVQIHVSGHAYLSTLKKLSRALKSKRLIPIHTLYADKFKSHFDNVHMVDDNVPIEI